MATNKTLTQLDTVSPLPVQSSDTIYLVRSNTSYKATIADLPSTGGGVTTIGTIDSETKSANGAVISGTDIVMQTADATHAGLVTRATTAEQQAGTDTAKYSTPETVAGAYNAYAPTVITSSSTLTTAVSMLIATGAGGYTTTLPDASTFPASQRGKPIYYVNNSSAANSIGVETGGYTSVTFSIIGATTTPPLYALSSTTLPTVSNMTIAGNVATATANSASAQTFDYVTTNNILQVTPKMTFTNGNVLSVDPTSATGNTKFNYATTNTVQVGSKVLVDVGGTVSEITVAAGSQSSNAVFDSSWGDLDYASANNTLFAFGENNRKLAMSTDNGSSWSYLTTFGGSGVCSMTSMVYLFGKYYIGLTYINSQGTINLYSSTDLINWTVADSQTFTNAGSVGVATNGTDLIVAYAPAAATNLGANVYIRKTTDGVNFSAITTLTFGNSDMFIIGFRYENSKFLLAGWGGIAQSSDGTSWQTYSDNTQPTTSLSYSSTKYIRSVYSSTNKILTSTDFTTWVSALSASSKSNGVVLYANGQYVYLQGSSTNTYTSLDTVTWTLNSVVNSSWNRTSCVLNNVIFTSKIGTQQLWQSSNNTTWTNTDLAASSGYTFTMTSPSIAVPIWAALGGQTEEYSVSATSTPSFTPAAIPVYTRSTNDITITYAAVTPSAYTHLQLKALTMNSGDVLKQIGADIRIDVDFNITIPVGGKYQLIPTSTAGWQSFQFAG